MLELAMFSFREKLSNNISGVIYFFFMSVFSFAYASKNSLAVLPQLALAALPSLDKKSDSST
jgi:hypothetical protein